ncbi:MAG: polymer-forming cytoskeletal protein [Candidatus Margulisiibacteriota bacterium]
MSALKFNLKKHFETDDVIGTLIGPHATIKGDLFSTKSIRIEGEFEGTARSDSEIIVGEQGRIKANLLAKRIVIAGEVIGNIESTASLEITKTGRVYGNIKGSQLVIEAGGIYRGQVDTDFISVKNPYEGTVTLATSPA